VVVVVVVDLIQEIQVIAQHQVVQAVGVLVQFNGVAIKLFKELQILAVAVAAVVKILIGLAQAVDQVL
jgi:hypothetical protein